METPMLTFNQVTSNDIPDGADWQGIKYIVNKENERITANNSVLQKDEVPTPLYLASSDAVYLASYFQILATRLDQVHASYVKQADEYVVNQAIEAAKKATPAQREAALLALQS